MDTQAINGGIFTANLPNRESFIGMGFPTSPLTVTMVITPQIAEVWLARNTSNRRVRKYTVKKYARDIAAGNWDLNGESLKFSTEGVLLDGQHRLMAIIEAGKAIESDVRFGLPPSAYKNIDTHEKRRYADVLDIKNISNSTIVAAALKTVYFYELQQYGSLGHGSVTNEELDDVLEDNPTIIESVHYGTITRKLIPKSVATGLHYLATKSSKVHADNFFNQLASGLGMMPDTPIHLLHKRLTDESMSSKRGKMLPVEIAALVIKAFNAYVLNIPMKTLRWASQGKNAEEFPRFIESQNVPEIPF